MITLGKVKEITVDFIKSLIYGKSDARTAPQCLPYGIDSKPIKGAISIYCKTENNSKAVMLGYIKNSDKTEAGEFRVFATDQNGDELFSIKLDKNGYCTFDGVGFNDNFVAYQRLKDEYDKTRAVVDAISNTLKTWTPILGDGGTALKTAFGIAIGVKVTGDISSSKIDKIKTT